MPLFFGLFLFVRVQYRGWYHNDNIFDGCFCGGGEGVNAVKICRLAGGSGFKVQVRRGIKPLSPMGSNLHHRARIISPIPLRVAKTGRNHLNEEFTPLLPTGIGERF